MKAKVELKQTRDFGEIIGDSIVFIRQNWKGLLKTYGVFCGFFVVGILVFSFLQRLDIIHYHNAAENNEFVGRSPLGFDYWMVLLFTFLDGISATLSTLCYIALYNQNDKQTPSIAQIWAYYKYYFWRIVGHSLLLGVIMITGIFIIIIPIFFLAGRSADPIVTGLFTFIVIIVPIFYFFTIFSVFFPIVIVENAGFGYAFSKCFKLVKGKWWNTFGVLFVVLVVFYAGFLLITIPFSMLTGGVLTFIPYRASMIMVVLYTVLMSCYQVFALLPQCASAVIYFSYAEEKESIGLLERIDTLGAADDITDTENETY